MPHECTTCGRVFADGSKEMLSGCPDCGGNKFQFKPATATGPEESATDAEGGGTKPEASDPTGRADDRADTPSDATETRRDLSEGSKEWPDHGYEPPAGSEADDPDPSPDTSAADAPAADVPATDTSPTESGAPPTESEAADSDSDVTAEPGAAETTTHESDPTADDSAEDPAQADARTDVVSPDEIAAATPEETEGTANPDAPGSPATNADDPAGDAAGRGSKPRPDNRPDLDDLREELNEQFESIRIVAPGEYELNLMELYDRTEYIISLQEDGRYVIEVPDTWDTTPDPDET
jgi:predicted  nucleic acid-binding Zn-ribbon protein